jgi:membrane protein DedA with SNARE-associated domain
MNEFLKNLIEQINMFPLWGLILFSFLSACLQMVFPPYPSEILLLIFGGLAVSDITSGSAVIISYAAGTVISSVLIFYLSRSVGKPILRNKYMRLIFSRRNQLRAGVYMRRYGSPALVICKFLPGVNTACIFIGGVLGLRGIAPILSIVFAGITQNVAYYFTGMLVGNNMTVFYRFSKNCFLAAAIFLTAIILFFVTVKFRNMLLKKQLQQLKR